MDCDEHIISESETCSVESYGASLRTRLTMFHRRTKSSPEDFNSMNDAVFRWTHGKFLMNNIKKYMGVA